MEEMIIHRNFLRIDKVIMGIPERPAVRWGRWSYCQNGIWWGRGAPERYDSPESYPATPLRSVAAFQSPRPHNAAPLRCTFALVEFCKWDGRWNGNIF